MKDHIQEKDAGGCLGCSICSVLEARGCQIGLEASQLKLNDKSIVWLVQSLAFEVHHFAVTGNLGHFDAGQLCETVLRELEGHLGDLLDVRCVATGKASCIGSVTVRFSDEVYWRVAKAAKNRVLNIVDGDGNA